MFQRKNQYGGISDPHTDGLAASVPETAFGLCAIHACAHVPYVRGKNSLICQNSCGSCVGEPEGIAVGVVGFAVGVAVGRVVGTAVGRGCTI